jgi:putative transposase
LWNKNVETYQNKGDYKTSTDYRSEFDFLKDVSAAAIQQKEIDFKAFKKQKFSKTRKKKLGAPKFKSRRNRQSFRLPNQKFKLIDNKLQLEKMGKIRIVVDRPADGKLMSVTVSKDTCGDYFASILVDTIVEDLPKTGKSVGIDVGLKALITTSDGLQVDRLRDNQTKTKHIQRRLAKKKKGSCMGEKLIHRLAKLHRKQARRREWLLHNISKHLVERYDTIVVEDLNVSGMMKNHCLAGAISDASWSELVRMLDYKCSFYGKEMIKINRFFPSSKTCNQCGLIKEDLKLSDRVFKCECGFEFDRDLNAALNILKAGGVAPANQTVMGHKTCEDLGLTQAIPDDLLRLL